MRLPSIKTLLTLEKFGGENITPEQAAEIRAAMEKRRGLVVANRILHGCGIESIGLPDGCFENCQAPDVDIRYVNLGETYARTLMKVNGQYRVGDWGSIVEKYRG